jgi:hypothetical protein
MRQADDVGADDEDILAGVQAGAFSAFAAISR